MKKIISLICALACVLSLTACQTNEIDTEAAGVDAETIQDYVATLFQQFAATSDEDIETIVNSKNSMVADDVEMALAIKRGLSSWRDAKSDLGDFVDVRGFDMDVKDDSVTGVLHLEFEERNADFTVVFNDDITGYTAIKTEPEYTMGEKMTNAGLNTLMGMGIVFLVLIFIAFLISLFKYVNKFENYLANRKDSKHKEEIFVPKSPENAPVVIDTYEDETDDLELVAVITAAIAASMNTSVDNLVVRSIRKRKNGR